MSNIYNAIQNLYNMDKTTWQEVLAELYNLVSNVENKFDLFENKFGPLLGKEVTKELKKMYNDGSLLSLINDKLLKDNITKFNQPIFSFSDDDGDTDLLTTLIPLSKELNVPFTIYTWYDSPIFTNYSDMQNMYWNYGWEFGYHTTGKITEQIDEVVHKEIINYKNKMSELGFNVDTFAYGYGTFDDRTVEIAKQYFNVALGTVMQDEYYNQGLLNKNCDYYRSKRIYISSWTPLDDYKKIVDDALKNNYWIVFFQHSRELTAKPFILEKLKSLIQYIQRKGGRIETVSNAYKILNNKKLYEVDNYYKPYLFKNFVGNPKFTTNEQGTSINVWNRSNTSKIVAEGNGILTFSESGQTSNTMLKIFQNINIPSTNEKFCFSIESFSNNISNIDGNYDGLSAFIQITVYNSDNSIVKTYRKNIKPKCNGVWCKNVMVINRMKSTTSKVEIAIIVSKNGTLKVKNPKFEIGDIATIDIS